MQDIRPTPGPAIWLVRLLAILLCLIGVTLGIGGGWLAGLGGSPARGQRSTALVKASWTASSATSMSPNRRTRTATARQLTMARRPTLRLPQRERLHTRKTS